MQAWSVLTLFGPLCTSFPRFVVVRQRLKRMTAVKWPRSVRAVVGRNVQGPCTRHGRDVKLYVHVCVLIRSSGPAAETAVLWRRRSSWWAIVYLRQPPPATSHLPLSLALALTVCPCTSRQFISSPTSTGELRGSHRYLYRTVNSKLVRLVVGLCTPVTCGCTLLGELTPTLTRSNSLKVKPGLALCVFSLACHEFVGSNSAISCLESLVFEMCRVTRR